jgi:molybdenum cofactor cytidylyltransferase
MIYGLIPAAGTSTRMGRPKLLLPLGDRTVLEWVLAAIRQAGIEQTLVVAGPHVPQLVTLAAAAGAHSLLLTEQTPDMRATIERGLCWLQDRFGPRPEDAFLLAPADHPTLHAGVIRLLTQARNEHPDKSIFLPTFGSRRGHPTLIGWPHVAGIQAHPPKEGLNSYLRRCANETHEIVADDPDVLCDLDTPEEYEALRRRWAMKSGRSP